MALMQLVQGNPEPFLQLNGIKELDPEQIRELKKYGAL
jgi:hypothetical protein